MWPNIANTRSNGRIDEGAGKPIINQSTQSIGPETVTGTTFSNRE